MLSNEIINLMINSIESKSDDKWVNNSSNCYLYAINCDIEESKIIYKDENGKIYFGSNLGEVSNNYKLICNKEECVKLFLEDCSKLNIEVKKVSLNYELLSPDEWLVSIYLTQPIKYDGFSFTDFHFIKKNYGDKFWSHKFKDENISYYDDSLTKIVNPTDFLCSPTSKFDNSSVFYEYVDVFCLKRKNA